MFKYYIEKVVGKNKTYVPSGMVFSETHIENINKGGWVDTGTIF